METVANNTSAAFLAAHLPSRKDLGLRNWERIGDNLICDSASFR